MNIEFIPLISFVLISTFTPGPNNISSTSMGILYGYRKTLDFLAGITVGFFLVMMACAFLSSSLLTLLPEAEKYLRWAGALYIIHLAVTTLRTSYSFSESGKDPKAFKKGFVLQLFNPKVAVYGITLYSTFLAPVSNRIDLLVIFALIFSTVAFAATSTWALSGSVIKNKLQNDSFRKAVNGFLCLTLVYTALDLSGIFTLL